ncbi:hypothetical protein MKX01_016362 [Papaver californicum]|nr:hypothetical protein MKX01_016362 [Papaver californicum]
MNRLSPFYNPLKTTSDRLRSAIHPPISRISSFAFTNNLINNIQSQVIPNSGDYLMKLSIGSPPIDILAIVDTGSDLTWIQCKSCENCFTHSSPLFDPEQSSTFRDIACGSNSCDQLLFNGRCDANNSNCEYSYYYGDLSHSSGILAVDKFTFDSTSGSQSTSVSDIVFGCGHHNRGSFSDRESGIVGLGGGPLSLVSQLGSKTDGKFSYCLLPMFENSTSKLNFGSLSIVSKNPSTYYYLTLEGVSVVNSGTTLTMLNEDLYDELESVVKSTINVDTTDDPNEILSLCYNNSFSIKVPEIIFHFTNADLHLNRLNTFIQTPYASLICLAMMPSQTAIFGNYAQVNFQIEYDTVGKKVSFAPKDCTKV